MSNSGVFHFIFQVDYLTTQYKIATCLNMTFVIDYVFYILGEKNKKLLNCNNTQKNYVVDFKPCIIFLKYPDRDYLEYTLWALPTLL